MDENYRKSLEEMRLHAERVNAAITQAFNFPNQMDYAHRVAEITRQYETSISSVQNQLSQFYSLSSPAFNAIQELAIHQSRQLSGLTSLASSSAFEQMQAIALQVQSNWDVHLRQAFGDTPTLNNLFSDLRINEYLLPQAGLIPQPFFPDIIMDKIEEYNGSDETVEIDQNFSSSLFETLKTFFPSFEIPIKLPTLTMRDAVIIIQLLISLSILILGYQGAQETKLYHQKVIELLEKQASIQERSTSHPVRQPNVVNDNPVKKLTNPASD